VLQNPANPVRQPMRMPAYCHSVKCAVAKRSIVPPIFGLAWLQGFRFTQTTPTPPDGLMECLYLTGPERVHGFETPLPRCMAHDSG
jgi:hypothetical protein